MFNVKLTVRLQNAQLLQEFHKEIKDELIKKGLDKPLAEALPELKDTLKTFVNQQIKDKPPGQAPSADDTPGGNMPKTDEELLKFLTGVDLDKIRKTGDYTSAIEAKVVVVDNNRAKLRIPISDSESFEENYRKALSFFSQAVYAMVDSSGRVSYYVNTGFNVAQYVKVVCSTDVGDTAKSRKKFGYYKNSNKMSRQGKSDIGRFAEWTLKQSGVEQIKNGLTGFINITNIIDSLKVGEYETASSLLKAFTGYGRAASMNEKVDDLKKKQNLTPGMAVHTNIMALIDNLKIQKVIRFSDTEYDLISTYSTEDSKQDESFFTEINSLITVWIINNSQGWFDQFVAIAQSIIKKYT